MASGATYNVTRFTRQVLKRYRRSPPSVVVHLYAAHFRFEHQHAHFGYDSPMKCFLEAIREQRLPTDLLDVLDRSDIPYYDGCLIVEVHDHRHASAAAPTLVPFTATPSRVFSFAVTPSSRTDSAYHQHAEVYRIVLAPNPATLSTDLALVRDANDPDQAVEMESVILNRTVPPLCLDPSIQTSRIANSMLRATTLRPPKRKRFCNSGECNDNDDDGDRDDTADDAADEGTKRDKDAYEKLMRTGDEGIAKLKGPAFSRLAFIQSYRERQSNPHGAAATAAGGGGAGAAANSLKAQPGSAITSIRLGGSQPTAGPGAPARGASPAVSGSQQPRPLKKRSHAAGAGGDMSDGATSTASLQSSSTRKVKKTDAASLEKKQQKLNQKKRDKERKRLEQQQQQQQQPVELGQAGGPGQAKFTWSGSQ
ncbi:hypothetical protein JCM11491_001647 [Sporobolomyces phaffii]